MKQYENTIFNTLYDDKKISELKIEYKKLNQLNLRS